MSVPQEKATANLLHTTPTRDAAKFYKNEYDFKNDCDFKQIKYFRTTFSCCGNYSNML